MQQPKRGTVFLKDLSEVDRTTLHLRGALGYFRPENEEENKLCNDAIFKGATSCLEVWTIIDSKEGIEFRRQYNSLRGCDADGNFINTKGINENENEKRS